MAVVDKPSPAKVDNDLVKDYQTGTSGFVKQLANWNRWR